jgi:hypothetical protein
MLNGMALGLSKLTHKGLLILKQNNTNFYKRVESATLFEFAIRVLLPSLGTQK